MAQVITFCTKAALQIGTGRVMRCLTLADALVVLYGADCLFICRAHEGDLIELIRSKGYATDALPIADEASAGSTAPSPKPSYRHWLGVTQAQDAKACAPILAEQHPDWLIVDHYALDACWELTCEAMAAHLVDASKLNNQLVVTSNTAQFACSDSGVVNPVNWRRF